ncbi:MAG: hypothetical protein ACREMO_03075, partial [Gemmatimonadales bacterium]
MAWLLLFLLVAAVVVARQTAAIQTAARLRGLRDDRRALEARRGETQRRIRDASGRQILGRKAEALGLHQPADSELVLFPM